MKTAILKLPEIENPNTIEDLEVATKLDTSLSGSDIKTTDFHPTESNKAVSVTENQVILWDISGEEGKNILNIQLEGKNNPKFTTGKWNPHQNCNQVFIVSVMLNAIRHQFTVVYDCYRDSFKNI